MNLVCSGGIFYLCTQMHADARYCSRGFLISAIIQTKEAIPMINSPWQVYQAPQAYQQQPYPQNTFRPNMTNPQMMDGPQYMAQAGMINARYVTCREEAVAAQIMDGTPWLFLDQARGMVYYKGFNSRTGTAEFIDFAMVQPQQPQQTAQPQFAPIADFVQLRNDVDQLKSAMMPAQQPRQKAIKSEEADGK